VLTCRTGLYGEARCWRNIEGEIWPGLCPGKLPEMGDDPNVNKSWTECGL